MKKIFFLIGSFFVMGIAVAQSNYFVHTIKDGETLTRLANKYSTTVGDIMRLNKMTTSSKLEIGEQVKIPKTADGNATVHVVAKGETLYSIAHKNNITINQLRDWNNITDNTIREGQILRLTALSTDANPTDNTAATTASTSTTDTTPVTIDTDTNTVIQSADNNTTTEDVKQIADNTIADTSTTSPTSNVVYTNPDEGVFATTYQSHANGTELITKGTAGVFKSSSGWQDKKYYILMNDIPSGSVVKVQANGKTVYAKVLWNLGNVKENQGLTYRISDAAASALNLSGDSFDIIVSYYK